MTTTPTDDTMAAITRAVVLGREGDPATARAELLAIWETLGPHGDPMHRCTLAHYLADLYDDAAQALTWDLRALDAADTLTNDRLAHYHSGLDVRAFYPSLHLNLADNYRRLRSFDAAEHHIDKARACSDTLPDNPYGTLIRTAIPEVHAAIRAGDTTPRQTAPTAR
ncbi:hypothetical protein [Nocardia sp. NPDC052566]|uniref:hypothetical protein n=1 Tax=Nocardia sp. NPDC052566 TaxID=3364330 RepID=UPI0037C572EE